ncbi:MAG TPA: type II toxin-antitoxin system VapC family toxin [Steroidobacteraceae bacterium]|nr:type II toxin-antitoxin system VapC family toxin [Steroidobacteraceae bacterium]
MVIDTSALVALLSMEPEAARIAQAIEADPVRLISAATLVEAAIVVEARQGEAATKELDLLLARAGVQVEAVTAAQAELARQGWHRFGKGRHAAGLNFGDCFGYALSKATGEALLFKGEDFTNTDVDAVRY